MIRVFLVIFNLFFPILFHRYIINKSPNMDFIVGRSMGSLGGHSGFIGSDNNAIVLQSEMWMQ